MNFSIEIEVSIIEYDTYNMIYLKGSVKHYKPTANHASSQSIEIWDEKIGNIILSLIKLT